MTSTPVIPGTPALISRVLPGCHYLVRVEDAEVEVSELLDGDFMGLTENATIAAGTTVTLVFSSDQIEFSAPSAPARLWFTKLKVAG